MLKEKSWGEGGRKEEERTNLRRLVVGDGFLTSVRSPCSSPERANEQETS